MPYRLTWLQEQALSRTAEGSWVCRPVNVVLKLAGEALDADRLQAALDTVHRHLQLGGQAFHYNARTNSLTAMVRNDLPSLQVNRRVGGREEAWTHGCTSCNFPRYWTQPLQRKAIFSRYRASPWRFLRHPPTRRQPRHRNASSSSSSSRLR